VVVVVAPPPALVDAVEAPVAELLGAAPPTPPPAPAASVVWLPRAHPSDSASVEASAKRIGVKDEVMENRGTIAHLSRARLRRADLVTVLALAADLE
jgi:hypothetical protein